MKERKIEYKTFREISPHVYKVSYKFHDQYYYICVIFNHLTHCKNAIALLFKTNTMYVTEGNSNFGFEDCFALKLHPEVSLYFPRKEMHIES